ncbi:MAG: hypothetical protein PVI75_02585 [Gammaproteobacteria bacterium]|jgi:hypothetical protein
MTGLGVLLKKEHKEKLEEKIKTTLTELTKVYFGFKIERDLSLKEEIEKAKNNLSNYQIKINNGIIKFADNGSLVNDNHKSLVTSIYLSRQKITKDISLLVKYKILNNKSSSKLKKYLDEISKVLHDFYQQKITEINSLSQKTIPEIENSLKRLEKYKNDKLNSKKFYKEFSQSLISARKTLNTKKEQIDAKTKKLKDHNQVLTSTQKILNTKKEQIKQQEKLKSQKEKGGESNEQPYRKKMQSIIDKINDPTIKKLKRQHQDQLNKLLSQKQLLDKQIKNLRSNNKNTPLLKKDDSVLSKKSPKSQTDENEKLLELLKSFVLRMKGKIEHDQMINDIAKEEITGKWYNKSIWRYLFYPFLGKQRAKYKKICEKQKQIENQLKLIEEFQCVLLRPESANITKDDLETLLLYISEFEGFDCLNDKLYEKISEYKNQIKKRIKTQKTKDSSGIVMSTCKNKNNDKIFEEKKNNINKDIKLLQSKINNLKDQHQKQLEKQKITESTLKFNRNTGQTMFHNILSRELLPSEEKLREDVFKIFYEKIQKNYKLNNEQMLEILKIQDKDGKTVFDIIDKNNKNKIGNMVPIINFIEKQQNESKSCNLHGIKP